MKATITLEDIEPGNVNITCEFSEPVSDETQSVAALLTMAIMMCACKAGGVSVYPPGATETTKYAVSTGESFREAMELIHNRVLESTGKPNGK